MPPEETTIRFRNIKAYLTDGTIVDLGARETTLSIADLVNSVDEPLWAKEIMLAPNPVTDILQISHNDINIELLQVFDSKGSLLFESKDNTNTLDTQALPIGIYNLRLFHQGQFTNKKFVKM